MPFDLGNLTNYALFKKFWNTPEGTADGLAHRGLDEVTPLGAESLHQYALDHELDGAPSAEGQKKVDADETAMMKAILEHDHYGRFFELDARPLVLTKFGLPAEGVHMPPTAKHPVDAGTIDLLANVSKHSPSALARLNPESLPEQMAKEYRSRKSFFDGTGVSDAERGRRALSLLKTYADALWARGEIPRTEQIGHGLLDAFEAMTYSKVLGAKDYNASGVGSAQAAVLNMDVNEFKVKFPDAHPTADTTYLAMNDQMAQPMSYVDQYREALGQEKKAEAFERMSPLGWMLGEESGHTKRGNLDEKSPLATSGLNWGVLLFPGDAEIKQLPPKAGFDFPIDLIDGWNNAVQARAEWGDKIEVVDAQNKKLKVEKVIERDASGKAVSWSAIFKDSAGTVVPPEQVVGLIKSSSGEVKGDGLVTRSLDMWWWGFCDRNTAQRLYKSAYGIPQLDRESIKIKAGDKVITVPLAEAQKLLDADMPDIVTGESFTGFRFNSETSVVKLKSGRTVQGQVAGIALEAGPGTTRVAGDQIAIHDAPGRPMLGTIQVKNGASVQDLDVRNIDRVIQGEGNQVTVKMKENNWPQEVTGEAVSKLPWNKAQTVDGKKTIVQGTEMPIRGGFTVSLATGGTERIDASDVAQIIGETQKDMRISQYMAWVSRLNGMYATDGSLGDVVSNGMRWVNKIDRAEETGDARPDWAGTGELKGVEGPLTRQAGDKIIWVKALYGSDAESEPTSTNFSGWIQVGKSGRILNEGFVSGQPDFGWGATGKLNWLAQSTFNPYFPTEMRLALLVNGVKDVQKLEQLAEKLNLPSNWKSYLVSQE